MALVVLYVLCDYFLSKITIAGESDGPGEIEIYILTNGVHTDIVVPVRNDMYDWTKCIPFENTVSQDTHFNYLAMGWGDRTFYLETPTWADLKASVAFKATFGLGRAAIHATFYRSLTESKTCIKIMASREQYERLVSYLENSLLKDENGDSIHIVTDANYGNDDAFYEAVGRYNLFVTCNTWANSALKHSRLRACFWTASDRGIFEKYRERN